MGDSREISNANDTERQAQGAANPRRGRFSTETPLERERRHEISTNNEKEKRQQETAEQRKHHLAQ